MFLRLFLLFTLVPFVELALLLRLGSLFGPMPTFLLIVFTGVVGAWMARREGTIVVQQLSVEARSGVPPAAHLLEGALVFIGGVLLITPGVLTDVFGFLLIFPVTRKLMAPALLRSLTKSMNIQVTVGGLRQPGAPPRPPPSPDSHDPSPPFDHPVAR